MPFISLTEDVKYLIDRMKSSGYRADVVGGCVRDSLLGRELGDFDITTNALPEQTKEVFSDCKTVDTGIKHGTVALILNGVQYEITTYRVDGEYTDSRHPDSVVFTPSLAEDLARRDFTVNAMAYNPYDGLTDLYGGREDLEARIIRAVGDPMQRFREDALRILRALRFSSTLDFDIEPSTAKALRERSELLSEVSRERVYTELKKLIGGRRALRVLYEYSDVISPLLCGMKITGLPDEKRYSEADYLTRLAALFLINAENPADFSYKVLSGLKTDKRTRDCVLATLTAYGRIDYATDRGVLRALADYGEQAVEGAARLGELIGEVQEAEMSRYRDLLASGAVYRVSELAINGGDLLGIGYKGEEIGRALRSLLYKVIDGELENTRESLLAALTE